MEWFQHELGSRDRDQIFELIDHHGCTGYGFWWALVEESYKAESTDFQLHATGSWLKRFARDLNITDHFAIVRMLDTLAEIQLINPQLWAEKVIYIPGIQSRVEAYLNKKRQNAERQKNYRNRLRKNKSPESDALLTQTNDSDALLTRESSRSVFGSKSPSTEDLELEDARACEIAESTSDPTPDRPPRNTDPFFNNSPKPRNASGQIALPWEGPHYELFRQYLLDGVSGHSPIQAGSLVDGSLIKARRDRDTYDRLELRWKSFLEHLENPQPASAKDQHTAEIYAAMESANVIQ